jgi:hypothetical protein
MAKLLRLRRGTTTQHGSFTGAEGEVTVDTDKDTLVVHDNATAGGRPMLREDLNNMPASGVTAGTYGSSSAIPAITVDAKGRVTSATTSAIDSTSIANGTSNVSVAASGDITVTRGGALVSTFTGSTVDHPDGIEARFGTSNDLRVYHDGANSHIHDNGAGSLIIRGEDVLITNAANTRTLLQADHSSASVTLFNDTTARLATTSTGIDVTGSVTCDGITSDGDITARSSFGTLVVQDTGNTGNGVQTRINFTDSANTVQGHVGYLSNGNSSFYISNETSTGSLFFRTNGTERFFVADDGHVKPWSTNTYDLGSSDNQWRDGYFDGTVNCDGLTCEGSVTITSGAGVLAIKDNDSTGNAALNYIVGNNSDNSARWYLGQADGSNQELYVQNQASASIRFGTNGSARMFLDQNGHLWPNGNNTFDLGNSSNRWRNVYTNDLNLSNEGGANDVDGTWGNWTIQEGEDDLFLLNRRNGKKYKFNLSEVN